MENPEVESEESTHFRIGKAIDCWLTSPEEFYNEFHVIKAERPSGLMGLFIDKLPTNLTIESDSSFYEEAYIAAGFKISLNTVINNLWSNDKNKEYYIQKTTALGKQVLSNQELEIVLRACAQLLSSLPTQRYFDFNNPDLEIFYQVPIYFSINDVNCKALLDGILINKKERTIQPFDLKSTGRRIISFPSTVKRFGYHYQGAFYWEACRQLFACEGNACSHSLITSKLCQYKDYTLLPTTFIVTSTEKDEKALCFAMTLDEIQTCLTGNPANVDANFHSIEEMLEIYKWHCETGKWDYPKKVYEKGALPLNIFARADRHEED